MSATPAALPADQGEFATRLAEHRGILVKIARTYAFDRSERETSLRVQQRLAESAIQHDLANLQVVRARSNRWLLLSSPLIWSILVIVVPHGLLGVDVYRLFGMAWVFANLAFGVAMLGAAAVVGRRLQGRTGVGELLGRLGDDLTGRRMAEAASRLDEIAAFGPR